MPTSSVVANGDLAVADHVNNIRTDVLAHDHDSTEGTDTLKATSFIGVATVSALWTHSVDLIMAAAALRWSTGVAVVGSEYSAQRNLDGTNLFQFNVPTGASLEVSVNDVAQMLVGASSLTGNVVGTGASQVAAGDHSHGATSTAWTPVLTFTTPGDLSVVYGTQVGRYVTFGDLVIVSFTINTSTFTHTTASGDLQITGLPFTCENISGLSHFGGGRWEGTNKSGITDIDYFVSPNTTVIGMLSSTNGGSAASVTASDSPTATQHVLTGTIAYFK